MKEIVFVSLFVWMVHLFLSSKMPESEEECYFASSSVQKEQVSKWLSCKAHSNEIVVRLGLNLSFVFVYCGSSEIAEGIYFSASTLPNVQASKGL